MPIENRDAFLVKGAARTFAWDFLVDFFSHMASDTQAKDVEYLDKARRFPPAGALFNEVSCASPAVLAIVGPMTNQSEAWE